MTAAGPGGNDDVCRETSSGGNPAPLEVDMVPLAAGGGSDTGGVGVSSWIGRPAAVAVVTSSHSR